MQVTELYLDQGSPSKRSRVTLEGGPPLVGPPMRAHDSMWPTTLRLVEAATLLSGREYTVYS
jgi:hypothetical protein